MERGQSMGEDDVLDNPTGEEAGNGYSRFSIFSQESSGGDEGPTSFTGAGEAEEGAGAVGEPGHCYRCFIAAASERSIQAQSSSRDSSIELVPFASVGTPRQFARTDWLSASKAMSWSRIRRRSWSFSCPWIIRTMYV